MFVSDVYDAVVNLGIVDEKENYYEKPYNGFSETLLHAITSFSNHYLFNGVSVLGLS